MGWKYCAFRMNGDGTESFLDWLPINGAEIATEISAPGGISGTIEPETTRLKGKDGKPLLVPWQTAIYPDIDGVMRGGAIYVDYEEEDSQLKLDTAGFTAYAEGMPYRGMPMRILRANLLDMARRAWDDIQKQPHGDLGIIQDRETRCPRVFTGDENDTDKDRDVWTRSEWESFDLGGEIDDLAKRAGFDYRMEHSWVNGLPRHFLRYGYPRLGKRLHRQRFVVGENVQARPRVVSAGDSYASEVIVIGAGEGSEMIIGRAVKDTDRLRRVAVLENKSLETRKEANDAARAELAYRNGALDISEITVSMDHPHAPLGTYAEGDEINVKTAKGWTERFSLWCRIESMVIRPEAGTVSLSLTRTEKVV